MYFSDISDKPGNVVVADHDNCSAEIKWDPPKSDGGAPIEKYIIQKKSKDKPDWENATEVIFIFLISFKKKYNMLIIKSKYLGTWNTNQWKSYRLTRR